MADQTGSLSAVDVTVVDYTDPDAPKQFTKSLRATGFAVLVNHPLPWSLVEQIYLEWAALFDSPAIEKYMMDDAGSTGWFPPSKSETAKGHTVRDFKEFFHVYDWSVYPHEVSDAAMMYRKIATDVAIELLDWVQANTPSAINARFSMPLSKMLDGSTRTLLRVLRYPPLIDVPVGAMRANAHEDINLLTVLPAADEPGLELLDTHGQWYPVPRDSGSLTVNAGEMLDLASGGYYPATTHRVVNPTGAPALRPRMALPLFLHPADDVVLAEGRTANEFLQQRIKELRNQDLSPS